MTVLQLRPLLIQAVAVLLSAPPVLAHHCSTLSDCWSTAAASAAAALGTAGIMALLALYQSITSVPQEPKRPSPQNADKLLDDP